MKYILFQDDNSGNEVLALFNLHLHLRILILTVFK